MMFDTCINLTIDACSGQNQGMVSVCGLDFEPGEGYGEGTWHEECCLLFRTARQRGRCPVDALTQGRRRVGPRQGRPSTRAAMSRAPPGCPRNDRHTALMRNTIGAHVDLRGRSAVL